MKDNEKVTSEYKLTVGGETLVTVKADREMTAGEALMHMIDGLMPYIGRMENDQGD